MKNKNKDHKGNTAISNGCHGYHILVAKSTSPLASAAKIGITTRGWKWSIEG